jgi:hypothetical protein
MNVGVDARIVRTGRRSRLEHTQWCHPGSPLTAAAVLTGFATDCVAAPEIATTGAVRDRTS